MLLLGAALGVTDARAATSTFDITVTIQNLSLDVGGLNDWDLDYIAIASTQTTWTATTPQFGGLFTVINDGNVDQDIDISVADSAAWTAQAAPGAEQFAVGFGQTQTLGTEPSYTNITTGGVQLTSPLAPTTAYSFDLQFQAPTSTVNYTEQTMVVTVTSSATP